MKKSLLLLLIGFIGLNACTKQEKHFITDTKYRTEVHKKFTARKALLANRKKELLEVFEDQKLSTVQKEALEYLYAYMPLSDLADYDSRFFLQQINGALLAQKTFSWSSEVPEDIFRHFVLPYRVNNEDLDSARVVFFKELKDRIIHKTMRNAALEVNHWCHEKVSYRGADIRTSAPLATVRTSFGRCGEESTFTVAAMRSVGIPARQVYTPRWAHTDDNHAWVEVYVDGKWQYLGACEPEPTLNKGWFDKPTKRAMLVHSNVFGNYSTTNNELFKTKLYTKINTLDNYTKTKTLTVKVVDETGTIIPKAKIDFGIYNYAEFYPMASLESNRNGIAQLKTGLGDLLLSASKGNTYGEAKSIGTSTDTVTIVLKKMQFKNKTEQLKLVPPVALEVTEVNNSAKEENDKRLAEEDRIRNAYQATFMQEKEAKLLADKLQLDADSLTYFIKQSEGNWQEISEYLTTNAKDHRVFDLLNSIAEKDLRDTPSSVLSAHLKATNTKMYQYPTAVYNEGILNPRLQNELLRPWRPFLQEKFNEKFGVLARKDITQITNWIHKNIKINNAANYALCPISPIGTFKLKTTDKQGRDLFFVALCRSCHIPARINTTTNIPQYYNNGKWINVSFKKMEKAENTTAMLILKNDKKNPIKAEYFTHFTLQVFKNGHFQTLDYYNSPEMENYPIKLKLSPGYYCLMTGHRDTNGSVNVLRQFFVLEKGKTIRKTIRLLPLENKKEILACINTAKFIKTTEQQNQKLKALIKEKGAIISILEPTKEPTRHIMVDIPLLKKEFDKEQVPFVFIIPKDKLTGDFNEKSYKGLPQNSQFILDKENKLTDSLLKSLHLSKNSFYPIVFYTNPKGEVSFISTGYKIGIGENLLQQLR